MTKISNQYSLTNILTADLANSRLGINNVSPTVALDVTGAGKFSSTLQSNGGFIQPNQTEIFASAGASNRAYAFSVGNVAAGDFTISQGSTATGGTYTTRLTINPAGYVGIGTSTPGTPLEIRFNADAFSWGSVATLYGYLTWGTSASFGENVAVIKTPASTGIVFQPAGTERMRITSGGILMINRTATGGQNARVQVSSSGTDGYFIEQISSGGFCNASIAISNGGTYYFNYFQAGGTGVGSITSNGTTTAYNVTSDYRLKEDLKPINGLNIVNKINVYDYKWKSENSRMDGVLAHELQEILPYAVTGEKDGKNMQGVDYSKIVPVLVKAIQELSAKVSLLENK